MSEELTLLPGIDDQESQKNPLLRESSDDLLRGAMKKLNRVELIKLNIVLISNMLRACYCDTPNLRDILIGLNTNTFTKEQLVGLLSSNPDVPFVGVTEENFYEQYSSLLFLLECEGGQLSASWVQVLKEADKVDYQRMCITEDVRAAALIGEETGDSDIYQGDHYDGSDDVFSVDGLEVFRDDLTPSQRFGE